jgi:MFS family permease
LTSAQKNVAVLATLQALLLSNNATAIALNALAGHALAPNKLLATLPVTGWVVGGAISTYPASLLMRRVGRRAGFTLGALLGVAGALLCSYSVYRGWFWPFVCGTLVLGSYNAFGQYYRFAAAETTAEAGRPRAISLVLAGGLVGGLVGPLSSNWTLNLLATPYLGAYLSLILFLALALLVMRFLDLPPEPELTVAASGRALPMIARQPAFAVAVLTGAVGYGVMNLLMTATPLAMGACGHGYGDAATVIASHVVGMYAPSFFTGDLIKRFGAIRVMLAGVFLNLTCVVIAVAGIRLAHFWWSLVLLGVGWNFMYVGATTLLTETYRPAERAKAQGANDAFVFVTMGVSSFASGLILEQNGWQTLNYAAVPFLALAGVALVWLGTRKQPAGA